MKSDLKIALCSHQAAKYAVEHWHYSKCLPAGKLVKFGVWENSKYIGVVIFSRGANKELMTQYNLQQIDGCELTRIALNKHSSSVSKILSVSIKLLFKINTGLKLVVSYADPEQGHNGAIYQASNWIYTGRVKGSLKYLMGDKWVHHRSFWEKFQKAGRENAEKMGIKTRFPADKHKYLYPLTKELRKQIEPLRKPYPKNKINASVV